LSSGTYFCMHLHHFRFVLLLLFCWRLLLDSRESQDHGKDIYPTPSTSAQIVPDRRHAIAFVRLPDTTSRNFHVR
jgi:hypothetical protein